jgi:hypothetical protein
VTVSPFDLPSAADGTPSLHLLQHLHGNWSEILQIPGKEEVSSLMQTYPVVRNSVLALVACHLRHVSPDNADQHSVAEYFQLDLALKDYLQMLERPRSELSPLDSYVLIISAVLLNILAFVLPKGESRGKDNHQSNDFDPLNSWVFSDRPERLGWLIMQAGLRNLVRSFPTKRETMDYLYPIFCGPGCMEYPGMQSGGIIATPIPEKWSEFFGVDFVGFEKGPQDVCDLDESNLLGVPIKTLAQNRTLKPVSYNLFRNLYFLSKMQPAFRDLLFMRDEKALWVFGYWLGLMCRFEQVWWCHSRTRRDYEAIRLYLNQNNVTERPGTEGKEWKVMMQELDAAPVYISS